VRLKIEEQNIQERGNGNFRGTGARSLLLLLFRTASIFVWKLAFSLYATEYPISD
jgi:hypothetical protein